MRTSRKQSKKYDREVSSLQKKKRLRQATSRRKGTQGCCLVKMWHDFSCGVLGPSFEFLVSKEGETFTRNSEAGP